MPPSAIDGGKRPSKQKPKVDTTLVSDAGTLRAQLADLLIDPVFESPNTALRRRFRTRLGKLLLAEGDAIAAAESIAPLKPRPEENASACVSLLVDAIAQNHLDHATRFLAIVGSDLETSLDADRALPYRDVYIGARGVLALKSGEGPTDTASLAKILMTRPSLTEPRELLVRLAMASGIMSADDVLSTVGKAVQSPHPSIVGDIIELDGLDAAFSLVRATSDEARGQGDAAMEGMADALARAERHSDAVDSLTLFPRYDSWSTLAKIVRSWVAIAPGEAAKLLTARRASAPDARARLRIAKLVALADRDLSATFVREDFAAGFDDEIRRIVAGTSGGCQPLNCLKAAALAGAFDLIEKMISSTSRPDWKRLFLLEAMSPDIEWFVWLDDFRMTEERWARWGPMLLEACEAADSGPSVFVHVTGLAFRHDDLAIRERALGLAKTRFKGQSELDIRESAVVLANYRDYAGANALARLVPKSKRVYVYQQMIHIAAERGDVPAIGLFSPSLSIEDRAASLLDALGILSGASNLRRHELF